MEHMRVPLLVTGVLTAALLSTNAIAQTSPTPAAPSVTTATDSVSQGKHWRSSKMIGVNIYNEQNEKLGDISEIILDPAGKVVGYVVGVGGFLGMGQHDILVEPAKIRFVNEPVRTSSTTPTTTTTTTTNNTVPPAGAPTNTRNVSNTTVRSANEQWYPDHGIMNATKDQLKAMAQFKY
jgi:sporulation protein YlmC with PRC-barrel domain